MSHRVAQFGNVVQKTADATAHSNESILRTATEPWLPDSWTKRDNPVAELKLRLCAFVGEVGRSHFVRIQVGCPIGDRVTDRTLGWH
jgi:hypothetical protein